MDPISHRGERCGCAQVALVGILERIEARGTMVPSDVAAAKSKMKQRHSFADFDQLARLRQDSVGQRWDLGALHSAFFARQSVEVAAQANAGIDGLAEQDFEGIDRYDLAEQAAGWTGSDSAAVQAAVDRVVRGVAYAVGMAQAADSGHSADHRGCRMKEAR